HRPCLCPLHVYAKCYDVSFSLLTTFGYFWYTHLLLQFSSPSCHNSKELRWQLAIRKPIPLCDLLGLNFDTYQFTTIPNATFPSDKTPSSLLNAHKLPYCTC